MSQPRYQLTVTAGPDTGKQIILEPGRTYKVGCDSGDDLVLTVHDRLLIYPQSRD